MGFSAGLLSINGCSGITKSLGSRNYNRPHSRGPFIAPRISKDKIVRVIVGLRPYRPSGFVVKLEEYDNKNIIHNYGHGGGGISLSWGSSALAVQEAVTLPVNNAAVIGSGIMGLTTARLLQDKGWNVTIYTRDLSRHSVSNVGAGQWAPTGVFEEGKATKAFEEQYKYAARISHHAYQNLSGANYGIRFVENYYLRNEISPPSYYLRELPELFSSIKDLEPHQHPFPVPYVKQTVTMMVEPATFLRKIRDDFLISGGKFQIKNFTQLDEILSLKESTIFNCTGLGSKALFEDDDLRPAKGQLVLLPPDPSIDYLTVGGGSNVTYMFPRSGEILLGGSHQIDDWSRNPEKEVTERIIEDNKKIFDNLRI
jgi:glycine/D-amino acid oxidase-like deaminating enzyme